MNENFKKALEESIPGLKIDGDPTLSDIVAIAQKTIEVGVVAVDAVDRDGKVEVADVTGIVRATIKLSPKVAMKAFFDGIKEEIKASKSKWDDVLLPVINGIQKVLGAN